MIVSTDIGGTDPDDFQSMVHLLLYADRLDIEGIISSSGIGGQGRVRDIFEVIDCYEKDYENLRTFSSDYPVPDDLRAVCKQGAVDFPPCSGFQNPTEGSEWIINCARKDDERPLFILGWGGIEDIAQALHDAPDILPKLRIHWVGGPNKKWGPNQYQYVVENFPELWIIESNATYRGWFTGGDQSASLGNSEFVKEHIKGKGALGEYFNTVLGGTIKMGDTPTVAWLLNGTPEKPDSPGWGGQFVRAWKRPFLSLSRMPTAEDQMEIFGILEIFLFCESAYSINDKTHLLVENQSLPGYLMDDGRILFRFCPKSAKVFNFEVRSTHPELNELQGAISVLLPEPERMLEPDPSLPNWWTDDPRLENAEGEHHGAKTVSKWRQDFLFDFASRINRCL
ncbi:MAG: DUF1593 domain-containing protein [Spirochaetales bacterium]|nr:DUF1593 domain-containing protein [Spirochaetales bacterium]